MESRNPDSTLYTLKLHSVIQPDSPDRTITTTLSGDSLKSICVCDALQLKSYVLSPCLASNHIKIRLYPKSPYLASFRGLTASKMPCYHVMNNYHSKKFIPTYKLITSLTHHLIEQSFLQHIRSIFNIIKKRYVILHNTIFYFTITQYSILYII